MYFIGTLQILILKRKFIFRINTYVFKMDDTGTTFVFDLNENCETGL